MPLINCEINLILIWSTNLVISTHTDKNQAATFGITDAKLYVPVVILSTDDNGKLMQQLKSRFRSTNAINIDQKQQYSYETNT